MAKQDKTDWFKKFMSTRDEFAKAAGLSNRLKDPRSKVARDSYKDLFDFVSEKSKTYYPNSQIPGNGVDEQNFPIYAQRLNQMGELIGREGDDHLHFHVDDIVRDLKENNKSLLERLVEQNSEKNQVIRPSKGHEEEDTQIYQAYNIVKEAKNFERRYKEGRLEDKEKKALIDGSAQEYADKYIKKIAEDYKKRTKGAELPLDMIANHRKVLEDTLRLGLVNPKEMKEFQDKAVKTQIEQAKKLYDEVQKQTKRTIYDLAADSVKSYITGSSEEFERMRNNLYSLSKVSEK